MTITPNAMPRKANLIHQQTLASLIETKPVSWTHKQLAKGKDGKEVLVQTKVTRDGLRFPLAQNVSDSNLDVMAKRWLP